MKNHGVSTVIRHLISIGLMLWATSAVAASPLDGRLKIKNERFRAVSVSIDGQRVGRVEGGLSRIFRNIPNGIRLVKIESRRGGSVEHQVSVPVRGKARLRIKARRGRASVHNHSELRMRVIVDGRYATTLAPGTSHELRPLARGRHTVTVYPAKSTLSKIGRIDDTFFMRPGRHHEIKIGPVLGQIKVINPFGQRVKLVLDGRRVKRLAPGESHVLSKLIPGMHTVEFKRRGRILATTALRVERGEVARWTPVFVPRGDLRVSNRGRRSVKIAGRGISAQWLGAGETVTIPSLREGSYIVSVTNHRGRTRSHSVRVFGQEASELSVGGRRARVSHRGRYDWSLARR